MDGHQQEQCLPFNLTHRKLTKSRQKILTGWEPFLDSIVGGVICLVNSVKVRDLNQLNSHMIRIVADFLETLLVFNQSHEDALIVLGHTPATMLNSASHILNQKVWVIFWKFDVMAKDHCNY